jgi:hypothetical protein
MSLVIVKCGRGSTYDKSRLTFQSLHFVDKEMLGFKLQNDVAFVAYPNLKNPKNAL